LLNNLIEEYRKYLDERYKDDSDQFVHLLKDVRNQFEDRYVKEQERLAELLEKIEAPVMANGETVHHLKMRELGKKIEEAKNDLAQSSSDRERIVNAL
jgi:acyl-CoA reductase-like NAD-dependent aldehyde dehydrogenase